MSVEERQARDRRYQVEQRARLKAAAIEAYGSKCACCNETEPAFLCIDHIGGGGARHREKIGEGVRKIGSGSVMHRWLARNNYPPGFQILCANCNLATYHGGCPHMRT